MSVDISRQRFDAQNDFCGVLMQQGRVQLDADWNELVELLDRRLRAETTDIVGRCVVPHQTPDGFLIALPAPGQMTIGPGRIYVDGLLAENHGLAAQAGPQYDPVLGELRGTAPVPYNQQPYYPGATLQTTPAGPYLVYVDVWQREVTYLEDPDLVEIALGVDTTARLQTVWQVKLLGPIAGLSCATPDKDVTGWTALTTPSGARLSTSASTAIPTTDPCVLPPVGGYRGLENQLYRVEIHSPGSATAPAAATFKWSRDNASVVTPITNIDATRKQLIVTRTARDSVLRVSTSDWIEVADDYLEFGGQPGFLVKVADVHDDTRTITLANPLPNTFPTGNLDPTRHTRLRRWDQKGKVYDTNNQLIVDLDAPGSTGDIPVPAAPATIVLENGVQIAFSLDTAGGPFAVRDYWVFAARTAMAWVEPLVQAPPRGIHHHYGRLAVVTFPSTVTSCRTFWPPDAGGAGCDCTACVTADSHNKGTLTIQNAIDQVSQVGGRVCLEPGTYQLGPQPLLINNANDVRLSGHGMTTTTLLYSGPGPAIAVQNSQGITLEDFELVTAVAQSTTTAAASTGPTGVLLNGVYGGTVQRCLILQGSQTQGSTVGVAIGLTTYLSQVKIRECYLIADTGIANVAGTTTDAGYLLLEDLLIRDNYFGCGQSGVQLDGFTSHYFGTWIAKNHLFTGSGGGIVLTGQIVPGGSLDVEDNSVASSGDAIQVGTSNTRIANNTLTAGTAQVRGNGIALVAGLDPSGLANCQVIGNRIESATGSGICLQTHVLSAFIKQNFIQNTGAGGIVMEPSSSADELSIANNQLQAIGVQPDAKLPLAGIQLFQVAQAEVASNTLTQVAINPQQSSPLLVGILVMASAIVRIAGNRIIGVGPPDVFAGQGYGILVQNTFDQLDIVENLVWRGQGTVSDRFGMTWFALGVAGVSKQAVVGPSLAFVPQEGRDMVGYFGDQLVQLAGRAENLLVRGNRFEAVGRVQAVRTLVQGSCVFTENYCARQAGGVRDADVGDRVVDIQAGAIVAGQNVVKIVVDKPQERSIVLNLLPGQETAFTVLGNLVNGLIFVFGAPLGAPWSPLNIQTFIP
jgi:hypothetical protein